MARYFTVEEANALVPRLRPLLQEARDLKGQADAAQRELDELMPPAATNGHAQDPQALRLKGQDVSRLAHQIQRLTQAVEDLGCKVKDLEMGLVDFPSLRNGREVYLCWSVDDLAVAFWHDLQGGYRGRQPL